MLDLLMTHRKQITIAAVIIGCFVMFFVAITSLTHRDARSIDGSGQVAATQSNVSQANSMSASSSEPLQDPTDEQGSLIAQYTSLENSTIALLESNLWTSADESATISFSNNTFTETSGAREISHHFAISSLDSEEGPTTDQTGNPVSTTIWTMTLFLEDGSLSEMTLIDTTSNATLEKSLKIISSDFSCSKSYYRTSASTSVEVLGLTDEFKQLIDNQEEVLTQKIIEKCSTYYPTATSATWKGKLTFTQLESSSTIDAEFVLNNKANTTIHIIYDRRSQGFLIN